MKKNLFLMIAAFMAMHVAAAPVDQAQAMRVAKSFLADQHYAGKLMAPAALNPVLYKAEMGNTKVGQPVYYIFNTSTTYVVVAGDDRAREILMVGDAPLDSRPIPDAMQYMLDCYKQEIEYLQARPGLVVDKGYSNTTPQIKAATYGPLLTCNWDQTAPYYNQCVFTKNGTTYQCLTGCAATSAAMVMYYWKYPTAATPTVPSYSFYVDDNYNLKITASSLPSTTFDWANMRNTYGWSYSTASGNAVATLMRYVGQAEKMGYGTQGSGIPSSEPSRVSNMFKLFGYDSNCQVVQKYYNTQSNWNTLIQNEMANGRPVVYLALSTNYGHAFNVDGYNGNSDLYHVNWGWSGYGNNWFAMNAFTDSDGDTFNQNQQAIIGIQPPGGQITFPVLTVEPDSIGFGTVNTGKSVSRTFHISGVNLLGDITFTRSGNAAFKVEPTTLTAAEVMAGADITVTYAPTTSGSHAADILIQGGAAANGSVRCSGTGQVVPNIVATPTEMSFTGYVGETKTNTFTVTGNNLTNTLYLSVVSGGGIFTLSKSNITKATAANGVEVTVTYKPRVAGVKNARVMLRSAGADTVYIDLTGTASLQTFNPVMLDPVEDYITANSFRADWTDETPADAVSSYTLECYSSSTDSHTFTDITDKFYTVTQLTPAATYNYRVKALYIDGTESAWSNIKSVTLHQGHAFNPGDVDHDGAILIGDATLLIDYLLSGNSDGVCTICADVDGDGEIGVADVSILIDRLLSGTVQ